MSEPGKTNRNLKYHVNCQDVCKIFGVYIPYYTVADIVIAENLIPVRYEV